MRHPSKIFLKNQKMVLRPVFLSQLALCFPAGPCFLGSDSDLDLYTCLLKSSRRRQNSVHLLDPTRKKLVEKHPVKNLLYNKYKLLVLDSYILTFFHCNNMHICTCNNMHLSNYFTLINIYNRNSSSES